MTSDPELEALRALAYGPGGGRLDAAQLRRLEELEAARTPVVAPRRPELPVPSAAHRAHPEGSATTAVLDAPRRHAPRGRWLRAALVAVLVVAAGVLGFRWGAASAVEGGTAPQPLVLGGWVTDSEASRERVQATPTSEVTAHGGWDAGVTLLAQYEEALVWWGTAAGGAQTCVTLEVRGRSGSMCGESDDVRAGGLLVGFDLVDVEPQTIVERQSGAPFVCEECEGGVESSPGMIIVQAHPYQSSVAFLVGDLRGQR
ncbi:hypothetical protein [Microbacterium sp. No. 7]|uniref:hypothetical protein n=1 Tax=Microbacterium sp. No. 7 TaxID=1714373 RepID=UPI0006D16C57|nr:hypothetical protein [Microbacterium sp. No. 7]ALJ20701.1 hypothetical protein AOA12_12650 [Microbacterium sp. No. 7]